MNGATLNAKHLFMTLVVGERSICRRGPSQSRKHFFKEQKDTQYECCCLRKICDADKVVFLVEIQFAKSFCNFLEM
jgi:hypothetical protein